MTPPTFPDSLLEPNAYPGDVASVGLHETHISWVTTTGSHAYKIRKAVRLPFVDFTSLEARKRDCDEELRLNRRMAPELYLGVVPISDVNGRIVVENADNVVDYAVKMREFRDSDRADHALQAGRLTAERIARFGAALAGFHAGFDRSASRRYGNSKAVRGRLRRNLAELGRLLAPEDRETLAGITVWLRHRLAGLAPTIERRAEAGDCRECHGDLHLGNLVLIDDVLTAFDCLEFDPALRWIDVVDDLAFLAMDLEVNEAGGLAAVLIDAYLRETGDYEGMALFDIYRAHRGLVRAKVAALSASPARPVAAAPDIGLHLEYVARLARRKRPRLVLMHGLPASGKSSIAAGLVETLPAIRISSDVERKRSAGLDRTAKSGSGIGSGLYTEDRSRAVYGRLAAIAARLVEAGWHTIVDAAFLRRRDREDFLALADELGCAVVVASCEAPVAELERRIEVRSRGRSDSEADRTVLDYARGRCEPLSASERRRAVVIDTTAPIDRAALADRLRRAEARGSD